MNRIANPLEQFHDEILDIFYNRPGAFRNLDELIEIVLTACKGLAGRLVEQYISDLSDIFFASNARREESPLRVKERYREKTLFTSLGQLVLRNDIYEDTGVSKSETPEKRKYFSPVLEALGLSPHQRLSTDLIDELVKNALDVSYAKSAGIVTNGEVSRQTVARHVRQYPHIEMFRIPDEKRRVRILELVLDEDHIALQHDKRKSTIIPVGVVFEGLYNECSSPEAKGRMRLKNPAYFVARDLNSASMTQSILGYIYATYDMDYLEKIRIHGDGAKWIMKALEDEARVEYVLDGFHLERAVRKFAGHFKDEKKQLIRTLKKAIKQNDQRRFLEIVDEKAKDADEELKKKCRKFTVYFQNNWDAAVARFQQNMTGSCTEAQVQHVLSCRMSTIAKSWSREGAGAVAALRAAVLNGVDIAHPRPEELKAGGYAEYMDEVSREILEGAYDFSIFDPVAVSVNSDSGTQHLLQMMVHGGQLKLGV